MSQLNQTTLSNDLDHIIGQRSTLLTGVLPVSIKDVEFTSTCTEMDESREVMVNGVEQIANAEYSINATKYTTLPSIGAILQDPSGRQVKVLSIESDDADDPVQLTMACNRRYSNQ